MSQEGVSELQEFVQQIVGHTIFGVDDDDKVERSRQLFRLCVSYKELLNRSAEAEETPSRDYVIQLDKLKHKISRIAGSLQISDVDFPDATGYNALVFALQDEELLKFNARG